MNSVNQQPRQITGIKTTQLQEIDTSKLLIPTDGLRYYPYYLMDETGTVYRKHDLRVVKPRQRNGRYYTVGLWLNRHQYHPLIHRLVMCTFNPCENMRDLQVNHIDGNKGNNNISNLEWVDCQENMNHAHKHGLYDSCKGEKHKLSRYADALALEIIRDMYIRGLSNMELRHKYPTVSKTFIADLRRNKIRKAMIMSVLQGSTTIESTDLTPEQVE